MIILRKKFLTTQANYLHLNRHHDNCAHDEYSKSALLRKKRYCIQNSHQKLPITLHLLFFCYKFKFFTMSTWFIETSRCLAVSEIDIDLS